MTTRLTRSGWEKALLLLVVIAAVVFRVALLRDVPPGLTHDEASNGHDAVGVLKGVRPIYFTGAYGHEPLYAYSVAPVMALLGSTEVALRLTTAAWGLALVLLTYGYARRVFGAFPALIAAGWLAVSFWGVMTSRVGLRAVTLATAFTASALFLWLGLPVDNERRQEPSDGRPALRPWIAWLLSGLCLGTALYTYMASRVMPAIYALFLIYLLLRSWFASHDRRDSLKWQGVVIPLVIAGIMVVPLVHFLVANPGAEQRIGQLSTALRHATAGDFRPLARNASQGLLALVQAGDTMWRYGSPGRPLVDPGSRILFLIGFLLSVWHWRDPRYAFLFLWLIVGLVPALIVEPEGITLRAIGAQPAVATTIGLGLSSTIGALSRSARGHLRLDGHRVEAACVVVLVAGLALQTAHDYFRVWGRHREVRVTYYHSLVEQARYLDAQPPGGAVAVSTQYPGQFHDPYIVRLVLRREDLDLRWFHGESAMVLPPGEKVQMIIPSIASAGQTLTPLFLDDVLDEYAILLHREHFRSDDLFPSFEVYKVDVKGLVQTLLSDASGRSVFWSASNVFPVDDPQAPYRALALPVVFGGAIELAGYAVPASPVRQGECVDVLTIWRVKAPLARQATLFTHLLDHAGEIVSQVDRLDVPSWQWQGGEVFVQRHRLRIGEKVQSGLYHLQVGLYTEEDMARLPVLVDGEVRDDRLLLPPLQVTGG